MLRAYSTNASKEAKEETDPGWEERKAKWEERKAVKRSRIEAGLPVHPDSDDTDDTE